MHIVILPSFNPCQIKTERNVLWLLRRSYIFDMTVVCNKNIKSQQIIKSHIPHQ